MGIKGHVFSACLFILLLARADNVPAQSSANACETLPRPDAGLILLPVYQSLPNRERYFSFIAVNMELHYHAQYARELVRAALQTGSVKAVDCFRRELLSYADTDPFSEFEVSPKNAQAVIEIDHTLRSLAYIYKENSQVFTGEERLKLDGYFVHKTKELTPYFTGNRHAKLYENWHALTMLLVGEMAGDPVLVEAGEALFDGFMDRLEQTMRDNIYDDQGYLGSYYKEMLNSLVAMAEISEKNRYADGRLIALAHKLLRLDASNPSDLFVEFPTNFVENSKLPDEFVSEISDNVYRLRYEFDHRTHMAWLHRLNQKFPTDLIQAAIKKYTSPLLEEHVGVTVQK